MFQYYRPWLWSKVIDLGCGTGDTVALMRRDGFAADGIDQVYLENGMRVGDITKALDLSEYHTATCFDVLEHISDPGVARILENMRQTEQQVISVDTGSSVVEGFGELHVNRKTVAQWQAMIAGAGLSIVSVWRVGVSRWLLCTARG